MLWTHDFADLRQLQDALDRWMDNYNNVFPHSSLCNCTPAEYERRWHEGTEPKNTRAKKILSKTPLEIAMNV
ncbi:MAG: integrase core domain-containing protein [Oligosphaeraceae bacterium]